MSKQQKAPGTLDTVRRFVNTFDVEKGDEQLGSGAQLAVWLAANGLAADGLTPGAVELRHAHELREALRAALVANNDGTAVPDADRATLDGAARRARIELRFDRAAGPELRPRAAGVDGALGRLLEIVHRSVADGTWKRLKACRNHDCAWAFYDHTRNRSGTWCNMEVCGNRAKARAFRSRHVSG
jgi:predicted RNA-binding Zn ribbon-like protein